jgi:hypothetical protein
MAKYSDLNLRFAETLCPHRALGFGDSQVDKFFNKFSKITENRPFPP